MAFISKFLDSIYQLLFQVNFSDLTFIESWYKYALALFSIYIILRVITMLIGFIIKFIKGVL